MQYYIKIFNLKTNELVGYYKETGKCCVTKLPKGMKYFPEVLDAIAKAQLLDNGFLRDKDGHYYTAHTVVCGDSAKALPKDYKKSEYDEEGDEDENAIETFIRKNSGRIRR